LIVAGLFFVFLPFFSGEAATSKDELKRQLAAIEQEISQYQERIRSVQGERKTLERETSLLENQVREIQLQINAISLSLADVEISITQKGTEIKQFGFLINREKEALAENIRLIQEADQQSLIELLMKNDDFSDFFEALNSLQEFQGALKEKITGIKELRDKLREEEEFLEEQKIEFNKLKVLQMVQQMTVTEKQKEKETLLSKTKGEESAYQKMIGNAQKDAQSLRQQLFMGGETTSGSGALTFEQAYFHAQFAAQKTGIRPAFLMALLKRETQWGKMTGSGSWRVDMNPKDRPYFVDICAELNLDPDKTSVSKQPSYGWGGAMGTAQFIPRTWWGVKDAVARLTGHNPPNPWDNNDAFTAAAYKLTQNGARSGNWNSEWKAAQIYFAGGNWAKPSYSFYGNSIMELAEQIDQQLSAAGLV